MDYVIIKGVAGFGVFFTVLNESLTRLLPMPKKIQKMDSKKERTDAFNLYISSYMSTFFSTIVCLYVAYGMIAFREEAGEIETSPYWNYLSMVRKI